MFSQEIHSGHEGEGWLLTVIVSKLLLIVLLGSGD